MKKIFILGITLYKNPCK